MDIYSDSTDRSPVEYILFALGFIGFLITAAGIVVGSGIIAVFGAVLLLLAVSAFRSMEDD